MIITKTGIVKSPHDHFHEVKYIFKFWWNFIEMKLRVTFRGSVDVDGLLSFTHKVSISMHIKMEMAK